MVIKSVDHVQIAIPSIAAGASLWERLGFTLTPMGRHVGKGTGNRCAMLGLGYVELVGLIDEGQPSPTLGSFFAQRPEGGALGLALLVDDVSAAANELAGRGIPVDTPIRSERLVDEKGIITRLSTVALPLPLEAGLGLRVFLCEHDDPVALRRSDWLDHPNGATGIAALTIADDDPAQAAERWTRVLERPFVEAAAKAETYLRADMAGTMIQLIKPTALSALHPAAPFSPVPARPFIAALTFAVPDLARAAKFIRARGVPFSYEAPDTIRLAPAHTGGITIAFRQP